MKQAMSVLGIKPGTVLSARDRRTLRNVGIVVIEVDPASVFAIDNVSVLPMNAMLRHALETIENANLTGFDAGENRKNLRADLGRRLIGSYLKLGEEIDGRPPTGASR